MLSSLKMFCQELNHVEHMAPEFLTPVDSSASDLFVHGNPLAGCNMSPDNDVIESHKNLYSRFVPGIVDRNQRQHQVLFLNSLGQPARETWRSLVKHGLLP
jgi:hypothetical protein